MRDESSYTIGLIGSINENIRIAREARLPVHISHIKALGEDVWGQANTVIALIKAARKAGLNVTADQYPYSPPERVLARAAEVAHVVTSTSIRSNASRAAVTSAAATPGSRTSATTLTARPPRR